MNLEWARKTVEALRSGRYKQTQKRLRTNEGFCCLGVMCDISQQGDWKPSIGSYSYVFEDGNNLKRLPEGLLPFFGMNNDEQVTLYIMNDDGHSFKEIADYIEQKWIPAE